MSVDRCCFNAHDLEFFECSVYQSHSNSAFAKLCRKVCTVAFFDKPDFFNAARITCCCFLHYTAHLQMPFKTYLLGWYSFL
jgi:hypothetical protein